MEFLTENMTSVVDMKWLKPEDIFVHQELNSLLLYFHFPRTFSEGATPLKSMCATVCGLLAKPYLKISLGAILVGQILIL